MTTFTRAKKTQISVITIGGETISMRIKWDSENQEWECNVKSVGANNYQHSRAYYTSEFSDAIATVNAMAQELAIN